MQAGGSTDREAVAAHLAAVANAPGEKIGPGELARGLAILSAGGEIDYVGATAVELTPDGDAAGSYRELAIEDRALAPVRIW